jgi:hypothetical protein
MKDNLGGGIQLGAGILGYILTIGGVVNIVRGADREYVNTSTDPYHPDYEWVNDEKRLNGGIAMTVIGGLLLTEAVPKLQFWNSNLNLMEKSGLLTDFS